MSLFSPQGCPENDTRQIDNRQCDPARAESACCIYNPADNHRREDGRHLEYTVLHTHGGSGKAIRRILGYQGVKMCIRKIGKKTVKESDNRKRSCTCGIPEQQGKYRNQHINDNQIFFHAQMEGFYNNPCQKRTDH